MPYDGASDRPLETTVQAVERKDRPASRVLNSTEDILADLRAGKMVIVMDDEARENEGDLLMLASRVRPEDINFMARYGRGLICLTLTRERCQQLRLPLMVSETDRARRTNFTVSIEAAEGVTTGISAHDRARTVRTAVAPDARPENLTQPGHVFPLMAQPGGVLTRAGHTEAGCDLARLAGEEPAAVIVEILNEDGSMARRADLERFAHQHGLRIGTIADLIRYRLATERSIEHLAESRVPTDLGEFTLHCYEITCIATSTSRSCAAASIPRCRRSCACICSTRSATSSACAGKDSAGRCAALWSSWRRKAVGWW
jgi:3,4-dihydroxy 2-butanone 4-phosphate synthase/GTP cyclohydrolase II